MHSARPPFSGVSISSNRYFTPATHTVSPSTTQVPRSAKPQIGMRWASGRARVVSAAAPLGAASAMNRREIPNLIRRIDSGLNGVLKYGRHLQ